MIKNKRPKRIGIDARFYGPQNKGLGRYCQKTVDYLEKIDGGNAQRLYFIFLRKDNFDLYQPRHKNFKKVKADFAWYSFGEQLSFPFFLNKFKLDLMHFCHFNVPLLYRKKFIVTIHDLILFHYPTIRNTTLNKYFYFFKLLAYRLNIKSTARRAKKIITVSDYTKNDIIKELKIAPDKVKTIYEGCDFKCFVPYQPEEKILAEYQIKKPFLLYVGNAYPHKNLERLVLAFIKAKKQKPAMRLVLVGKKDYFYRRLEKFVQEKKVRDVIFSGYVPDNDLDILYKNTRLYVFPSLYEGFGLPPLEALMKNVPVASSNRTSLPEVLGELVTYFNPGSTEDIYKGIKKGLKSEKPDLEKIVRWARKFDWEEAARKNLEVYEEI